MKTPPPDFSEAFRVLRTNVLFSSASEGGQSIIVTSTGPGEGKSLVASNLAISLALAGRRYCRVDDSEIGLESPRYSHDTIAAANRLRGGRGVAFLLGEDSLHDVPGWRMGWRLLEMCPFITQRRASGTGRPVPPSGVGSPGSNRRRVLWLKRPGLPVSSTEIRAIVHAGHALEGRVPAAVAEYIAVHRLYS